MPDDHDPIQRSRELAPFSRDHHESLLFAWKLKKGLHIKVSEARIAAFVHWYWETNLEPHLEKEEVILLPYLSRDRALKARLLEEHGAVRKLVQEVKINPARDVLLKLAEILTAHIRFEERILFKHLEVSVAPEELARIGQQAAESDTIQATWTDSFWLRG